jgi:hypothetical protein
MNKLSFALLVLCCIGFNTHASLVKVVAEGSWVVPSYYEEMGITFNGITSGSTIDLKYTFLYDLSLEEFSTDMNGLPIYGRYTEGDPTADYFYAEIVDGMNLAPKSNKESDFVGASWHEWRSGIYVEGACLSNRVAGRTFGIQSDEFRIESWFVGMKVFALEFNEEYDLETYLQITEISPITNSVPEAGTSTMLLTGLISIGLLGVRRRIQR